MSKAIRLTKNFSASAQLLTLSALLVLFSCSAWSQGLVADFSKSGNYQGWQEQIKIIAPSRKILILSNKAQILTQGDFITLVYGQSKVIRALVVKTTEDRVGIKVVKIYDEGLWQQSRVGDSFSIIRGDDSYFSKSSKTEKETSVDSFEFREDAEIDLEDEDFIRKQWGGLSDRGKRNFDGNHLLSFGWGTFQSLNREGDTATYNQWILNWSYQFKTDYFIETGVSTAPLKKFPAVDLNSQIIQLTLTAKMNFKLPAFFFLQPYAGFVVSKIQHSAGEPDGVSTPAQLNRELELIEDAERIRPAVGVSLYRRLVPGWLARADLGTNTQSLHLTLEF